MNLADRIKLLVELGNYMKSDNPSWVETKKKATAENPWFIPEFLELAIKNITDNFLHPDILIAWAVAYKIPEKQPVEKTVGIVMAGNLPLVGFHDLLATFISGHRAMIKTSSKDDVLIRHLAEQLEKNGVANMITFSELLKNCDAYIATGSNNTSRYFEYYFSKYRHIIRRNKTSVAILNGDEDKSQLEKLADDVYQFFGLGCRNVSKIYVPQHYDFIPLLDCFKKYDWLADHHKYKNNYDYNLTVQILNKKFYMTNGSIILAEENSLFSPISQLNYEFYTDKTPVLDSLKNNTDLQCIVSESTIPFGQAQSPSIMDYADKVDTMAFLASL
jgi:acyl-CoA reductase LuxC